MPTVIKPFDSIYSYEPAFGFSGGYGDITYIFQDGGGNWIALLFAFYQLSSASLSYPQVFSSADSGVSWSAVGTGRPNTFIPVLYDPAYTASVATILYAKDTALNFGLIDYTFATNTYSAPYGALALHLGTYSDLVGLFIGRSDGSFVLTYDSYLGGGVYRIYSAGAWGAEQVLPGGVSGQGGIAVDASDNVHLVLKAPDGSVSYCLLDPATDTITVGPIGLVAPNIPSGNQSNVVVIGTTVMVALLDVAINKWRRFSADPPYTSWSHEDITGMDLHYTGSVWLAVSPPTTHVLVFAQGPFDNNVTLNVDTCLLNQTISAVDYLLYAVYPGDLYAARQTVIDRFTKAAGAWSGPTPVYTAPYNLPPDDWANVVIWHLNIFSGAIPANTHTVHHTTNSYLGSPTIAGNKYRGFYQ